MYSLYISEDSLAVLFSFHWRSIMKERTPTALLREKFPHIQSSSRPSLHNPEQHAGMQTNIEKSHRELLVSHLKAQGFADPNFKTTKLGTGERERFIAAVTVSGQQFKTYPRTFSSKAGWPNWTENLYHLKRNCICPSYDTLVVESYSENLSGYLSKKHESLA